MEQETPLPSLCPSVLKTKECVPEMEKQTIPLENYKGSPRACRDAVRKPAAQFRLKLARVVKNHNTLGM